MNKERYNKSQYKGELGEVCNAVQALRRDTENPIDVSLGQFIKQKWNISMNSLYEDLGINPGIDTIENIITVPDESVRFLLPEIIRDALRLGLRKAPIWADLIAAEQTIANPRTVIPHFDMSDAAPKYVGEGETIGFGAIQFGSKDLTVRKMGRGIRITYETRRFVSINLIAIYMQDWGVKLNHAIDAMAIDTLINGEQGDGSESAPVIGVANTTTGFTYRDILQIWVRLSRIGRMPTAMIGGEDAAIDILNLDEFKKRDSGTTEKTLSLRTAIPQSASFYIHGAVPADQIIYIDPSSALVKYNAQPLLIEEQKVPSNQTMETYATLMTGFGILYRDGRVIQDESLAYASNGFPSWMDVDALEQVTIED